MTAKRDNGSDEAYGERFAIASGRSEASRAAADCLAAGGNVVDAAIAGSAVLCTVLPNATSIGGDLFAVVKVAGRDAVAVNATGAAPARASIEAYRAKGHRFVPMCGGLAVQGPGLVAGWQVLHERWGSRALPELLAPAIDLARGGCAVGWRLAGAIASRRAEMEALPGWKDLFMPGGRPLAEGDRLVQPALAATLARIAAQGARAFYEGPVARDIARSIAAAGGFLAENDLADIRAETAPPLTAGYRDLRLYTQPPISQGLILLRALRLLERAVPNPSALAQPAFWAEAARALRRAFDDRLRLMGDGADARAVAEAIVEGSSEGRASVRWAPAKGNETSTLAIMDARGNAVSLIQSVYSELGSGVVASDSGILLNNRMLGFHLDPAHPNALAPRRRTMHTLHSFIAEDAEGLRWVGGSPGGDQQPQVNLQVLARLTDFRETPARAVAAPRWSITPGTREEEIVASSGDGADCEPGVPEEVRQELASAGFAPQVKPRFRAGSSKIVGRGRRAGELGAWACWRREGAVAAG